MFRWGDSLKLVACQAYRQRVLFGPSNPPVIDDVIPVRYIILEIIGKARWEGFMQADFQKHYGMDPRTSFHHIKNLIKLHLITKQVRITTSSCPLELVYYFYVSSPNSTSNIMQF